MSMYHPYFNGQTPQTPTNNQNNIAVAAATSGNAMSQPLTGAGPSGSAIEEDDDDGSPQPLTGKDGKKSRGGRPKDFIWSFFDGDREKAICRACGHSADRPKAFRMRQHVIACAAIPSDQRQKVQEYQQSKDEKVAEAQAMQAQAAREGETITLSVAKKRRMADSKPVAITAGLKGPITCHVLDSTSGRPGQEMGVRLDRLTEAGFVTLANGLTDGDGRCNHLLQVGTRLELGIFKVTFSTSDYFSKRGILTFYPFVEILFEVKSADEHYHIPLLLAPYSYSTYRGS